LDSCAVVPRVRRADSGLLAGKWHVSTTRAAAALSETGTQCPEAPAHESHLEVRKARFIRGAVWTLTPATDGHCLQAVLQSTLDVVRRLCEASTNIVKVFPVEDRLVRA
jgi:hypothetical protein